MQNAPSPTMRPRAVVRVIILAVLLVGLTTAAARADTPLFVDATPADSFKVHWLLKAKTPPKVDGRLDDPFWEKAEPLTDWGITNYGRQKGELGEIDFRAGWDEDYLYIGARMSHRRRPEDMKEFRRQVSDRSKPIYARECLEIHIDGNLDHATRFQSIVNALGEKMMIWHYDFGWGLLRNEDYGLDADWKVVGRIAEESWTVEVRYGLADIQVQPRVGSMFGINPCWFNWADTRKAAEHYWWQFLTWSTHGDSHHDPRLYGRFVLVEERPEGLREGLRLAFPDLQDRTVMIQTPEGFTVFREGRRETVRFDELIRREARAAREEVDRLKALFETGETSRMGHVRENILPEQEKALREVEARLDSDVPLGPGELAMLRKTISEIADSVNKHYWRVKQDVLLSGLGGEGGE